MIHKSIYLILALKHAVNKQQLMVNKLQALKVLNVELSMVSGEW